MKARTIPLALLALALASTACQPPAQEAAGLSEEDVATIEDVLQEWGNAVLAWDWEAWAELYEEDALLMPPNHRAQSRAEYRADRDWYEANPTEVVATAMDIDGRGDLAYLRAEFSETYAIEGTSEQDKYSGNFIWILRKQPDGVWRVVISIYNSDLPLPEEGTETDT
jgi:uncharacterized protein (TIGR02246 family)